MNKEKNPNNRPQGISPTGGEGEIYGQYIAGDYGRAGIETGRHFGDEDGQYIEGDYGRAGTEPGVHDPFGLHPGEGNGYVSTGNKIMDDGHEIERAETAGTYTDVDALPAKFPKKPNLDDADLNPAPDISNPH